MSTGAIVGVVVAILFLVAVLVVAMLLKSRRQKRRAASKQTISDPTSGTIGVLVHGSTSTPTSAASPPQLTGTLHMRSSTSGMYKKIKMTIEGDTLRYADFKSNKYSVLHGSNVEQLEVVNYAQLEFVLKTNMSGPERGRSYSFRVSTRAEFARWTSGLEQWLGSLPQEPLPARFEQMNRLDNLGTPSRQATRKGGPATTAAPSPARIAVRRI